MQIILDQNGAGIIYDWYVISEIIIYNDVLPFVLFQFCHVKINDIIFVFYTSNHVIQFIWNYFAKTNEY